MKKFFALVLAMLMCCSCAFAEEAVSELPVFAFDPASVEGMDGGFAALEACGLQVYLPGDFVAYEPSESDVARGVISVMGREDGSLMMSISMAGVADADGNLITDLYTLCDFYAASNAVAPEVIELNGLPALSYGLQGDVPTNGIAVMFEGGIVVAFNVTFAAEAEGAVDTTAVILSSIMLMETVAE